MRETMNGSDRATRSQTPYPPDPKSIEQRLNELEKDTKTLARAIMFLLEAYVDKPEQVTTK